MNSVLLPLICLISLLGVIGCHSNSVDDRAEGASPLESARTDAESQYGAEFTNLMLEFKEIGVKAQAEMDAAEKKGLPKDPNERRAVLLELMEVTDLRTEAIFEKAQRLVPPPRYVNFHSSVITLFRNMVSSNTRYREAVRNKSVDSGKLLDDGLTTMREDYEKMQAEGSKLGVPMPDLEIF